jgi:hypothetical protein
VLREELPAAVSAAAPAILEAANAGAGGGLPLAELVRREVAADAGKWEALIGACAARMQQVRGKGAGPGG